jgi:hypothetical protein
LFIFLSCFHSFSLLDAKIILKKHQK